MKVVADEGIDAQVVAQLRAEGHRVISFAESDPGADDERVLEAARTEKAILLTADKDSESSSIVRGSQQAASYSLVSRGSRPSRRSISW